MIQAFFFDLQAINSGSLRPQGIERWQATKVGVLGAGMMGAGIAYSCARAGMQVVLKDVSLEAAEKGKAYTAKLNAKGIERGKLTQEKADELLGRITATASPEDLAGCDLVIEAVFEDPSLKAKVFAEVAPFVDDDALLCSNTSTLPITELAGGHRPPGRLHRPALLQPRRQDAARRDHPRRGDLRRRARQGVRRRAADPQDADRGQRLARLLHLARHRHPDQRGPDDARRGRAPGLAGAGRDVGRLPGRAAADQRRAQHGADGQDPQGHRGRRRARGRRPRRLPGRRRHRDDDRPRPPVAAQGRRLLRLRRQRPAYDAVARARRDVPRRRAAGPDPRRARPDALHRGARDREVLRGGRASPRPPRPTSARSWASASRR